LASADAKLARLGKIRLDQRHLDSPALLVTREYLRPAQKKRGDESEMSPRSVVYTRLGGGYAA
jgi:hypothetical protein